MPKVLIADKMSPLAEGVFKSRKIDVDVITGLSNDELAEKIKDYDGLVVRSSSSATAKVIENAPNLKVVGRAGIGVDNIDIPAASKHGVVVMNTPFGNSITTAEHAIAMMMALSRKIPQANTSTHGGKWEKSKFMGVELMGKTLGVIGCGNIGSIAADRALGLKMKVVGYDPFLTLERAEKLGIEKVELDELFARADFITLHTPKTDKTAGILNKEAFAKMKDGVRIINCARGGLVIEADLKEALESGKVAAAALDVFEVEPAKENPLFGMENVIVTPHLGASTSEAQEKVAVQIAEQIADYLLTGAVTNALNMPSVSADEAPKLKPYMKLAEVLGSFVGQVTQSAIHKISIAYEGQAAELNVKPLTAIALKGVLASQSEGINLVSAPTIAQARGIEVEESVITKESAYHTLIRITVETNNQTRSLSGTLTADTNRDPRIVDIKGIGMDAKPAKHMLYITNNDKPGFIGQVGTLLGRYDINIANFYLGRLSAGSEAIILASIDGEASGEALSELRGLENATQVSYLTFDML
ncbi:MAG: phosphoglycerate dehydrogenase [Alphaproteobacteria bacterium]